ncbi:hypothetical protein HMPREF9554_00327 [Treponema phagedenis F0421]|nr:hypothetical protein HMPREF9554_00327 [Treponema phagedenis F0421]
MLHSFNTFIQIVKNFISKSSTRRNGEQTSIRANPWNFYLWFAYEF